MAPSLMICILDVVLFFHLFDLFGDILAKVMSLMSNVRSQKIIKIIMIKFVLPCVRVFECLICFAIVLRIAKH